MRWGHNGASETQLGPFLPKDFPLTHAGVDGLVRLKQAFGNVFTKVLGSLSRLIVPALQGLGIAAAKPSVGRCAGDNGASETQLGPFLPKDFPLTHAGVDGLVRLKQAFGNVFTKVLGSLSGLIVPALQGLGIAAAKPSVGRCAGDNGASETQLGPFLAKDFPLTHAGVDGLVRLKQAFGNVFTKVLGSLSRLIVPALQGLGIAAAKPSVGRCAGDNGASETQLGPFLPKDFPLTHAGVDGLACLKQAFGNVFTKVLGSLSRLIVPALQGLGIAAAKPSVGRCAGDNGASETQLGPFLPKDFPLTRGWMSWFA